MNTSSNRHRLMEDTLVPAALEVSLSATRRAARVRRVRRRLLRTSAAGCLIVAGAWLFQTLPGDDRPAEISTAPRNAPPFVLVTNGSSPAAIVLHSAKAPPGLVVTTQASPASVPSASREDVFTSAGERPGGLIHLADGSARWMWLDLPELE